MGTMIEQLLLPIAATIGLLHNHWFLIEEVSAVVLWLLQNNHARIIMYENVLEQ